MSEGWISIHRQIWKHWLWEEKRKLSKAEAWIDLLLLANYEDKDKLMNNVLVTIKRGQLITSEVKLAERWRWDRKTVRRYLSLLENDQMLVKEATTQWTRLTLINYDLYQLRGATESPTEGTTEGQRRDSRRDTTNNINKTNKDNKVNKKQDTKIKYSDFVKMEEEQYQKLLDEYGLSTTKDMIQRLNNYIGSKGKHYKSHYHTILTWIRKDKDKKGKSQSETIIKSSDSDLNHLYYNQTETELSEEENPFNRKEVM